jgi:hypothetical protein
MEGFMAENDAAFDGSMVGRSSTVLASGGTALTQTQTPLCRAASATGGRTEDTFADAEPVVQERNQ